MNVIKTDRTVARRLLAATAVSLAAAATLVASPASAQETASMSTSSSATATAGTSDHSRVAGHLAILWLGVNGVPIGAGTYQATGHYENGVFKGDAAAFCGLPNSSGNGFINGTCRPKLTNSPSSATEVPAPTVGIRYWLSERLGIDAGLGLGFYSGSVTSYPYGDDPNSQDITFKQDKASIFAMTIHGGVPIVLGEPGKHYTFEVIPEANVGFASGTQKDQQQPPANPRPGDSPKAASPVREDFKVGGFRLDVGARAGAEVHFGFMGIPELALQGTVGLYFTYRSVSASVGGKTASDSDTGVSTSVQQAPWAIFTNNISALYYF